MSLSLSKLAPFALIGGVILGLYLMQDHSVALKGDTVPIDVPQKDRLVKRKDDEDATFIVKHVPSGDTLTFRMYGDELREKSDERFRLDPAGNKQQIWDIDGAKYSNWIDPGFDLGIWVGFVDRKTKDGDDNWDYGVRASPVRFLHGYVAPDALFSKEVVGLGVSSYPFPNDRYLRHVGLGYGRVFAHDDGAWCNLLYLSTEFRF